MNGLRIPSGPFGAVMSPEETKRVAEAALTLANENTRLAARVKALEAENEQLRRAARQTSNNGWDDGNAALFGIAGTGT